MLHPGPQALASRWQSWCWLACLRVWLSSFLLSCALLFLSYFDFARFSLAKLFPFVQHCTRDLPLLFFLGSPEPGGVFRILSSSPLQLSVLLGPAPSAPVYRQKAQKPWWSYPPPIWRWPPLRACNCVVLDMLAFSNRLGICISA